MVSITPSQSSMTGGEITPSLYARVDLSRYTNSLKECKNFVVKPEGGVVKRSGLKFVGQSIAGAIRQTQLIPFQVSADQSYLLEFTNGFIRVIKDGAYILNASTNITGITSAAGAVFTSVGHGLSAGDQVFISGVNGMPEINGRFFDVSTTPTADTFTLAESYHGVIDTLDTSAYGTYTSGGTVAKVYSVAIGYAAADIGNINFTQSADVLYLARSNRVRYKVSRVSDTNWTVTALSAANNVTVPTNLNAGWNTTLTNPTVVEEYVVTTVDAATGSESIASTSDTAQRTASWPAGEFMQLTWTAVTGAEYYNVYKKFAGFFGLIGISDTNSFDDNNITPDTTTGPPTARDPFVDTGIDPTPAAVEFFEDRLVWAGGDLTPQTVQASVTGQYENHDVRQIPVASDAIEFTLNARNLNEIRDMVALDRLLLFTSSAIWAAWGRGDNQAIRPGFINAKPQSYNGSSDLRPILIGDSALYVETGSKKVRDLFYQINVDRYTGNDLSIMASHLFEQRKIVSWAYSEVPGQVIWCVMDDGSLLSLTYNREHEVWGWAQHESEGYFEYVAVVRENDEDIPYFVVRRTSDGNLRSYVERMAPRYFSDQADSFFVDSGLSYDGAAATTFYGMGHLEGQTVTMLADGYVVADQVVTNATVTCPFAASKVSVGLPYTSSIETLEINASDQSLLPLKRIVKTVHAFIRDTRGLFALTPGGTAEELAQRDVGEGYGAISTDTAVVELPVDSSWNNTGRVRVEARGPLPAEILSIMPEMNVGRS